MGMLQSISSVWLGKSDPWMSARLVQESASNEQVGVAPVYGSNTLLTGVTVSVIVVTEICVAVRLFPALGTPSQRVVTGAVGTVVTRWMRSSMLVTVIGAPVYSEWWLKSHSLDELLNSTNSLLHWRMELESRSATPGFAYAGGPAAEVIAGTIVYQLTGHLGRE